MGVQYVKDFNFAPSPARPTIPGYARGGHVKSGGSAGCYAKGGSASPDIGVATGKVAMGSKPSRNPDDATSPGSPKRTPMSQKDNNQSAARNKFATEGRGTPVATKQDGEVPRMSGYSDFHNGGRIKNLGHYAHGGKVVASKGERSSGTPTGGKVKAPERSVNAGKAERAAGTPKTSPGSRVEMKGGVAKAAMGGLSRGTSRRKSAAIHAKTHKPRVSKAGLGALAAALGSQGAPPPAAVAPPGMASGMGAPAAPPMGGPPPQAPPMKRGGRAHK